VKVGGRSAALFGGGAGAVFVAAAVARFACPAGCQTCETCVASVAPMGAGLLTLAGVMVAGGAGRRRRERDGDPGDGED
jgi:hypothetical protein